MAEFSFGFTEGIFLLLNGQKHLKPGLEVSSKSLDK